eukprot:SAG11_NODE_17580_length_514_cov_1.038554_1_plen_132_part_10
MAHKNWVWIADEEHAFVKASVISRDEENDKVTVLYNGTDQVRLWHCFASWGRWLRCTLAVLSFRKPIQVLPTSETSHVNPDNQVRTHAFPVLRLRQTCIIIRCRRTSFLRRAFSAAGVSHLHSDAWMTCCVP